MTTAKDLLSLPSLSHMKLIGGAKGLSRVVTWPYVILCPPIGEWVSGGEFLIYYGANSVVHCSQRNMPRFRTILPSLR